MEQARAIYTLAILGGNYREHWPTTAMSQLMKHIVLQGIKVSITELKQLADKYICKYMCKACTLYIIVYTCIPGFVLYREGLCLS